jgi:hypothetical protein
MPKGELDSTGSPFWIWWWAFRLHNCKKFLDQLSKYKHSKEMSFLNRLILPFNLSELLWSACMRYYLFDFELGWLVAMQSEHSTNLNWLLAIDIKSSVCMLFWMFTLELLCFGKLFALLLMQISWRSPSWGDRMLSKQKRGNMWSVHVFLLAVGYLSILAKVCKQDARYHRNIICPCVHHHGTW